MSKYHSYEIEYQLERGDELFELTVEYTLDEVHQASWDDPAWGGEIITMHVTDESQGKFPLSPDEEAAIEKHIYETHDYTGD